MNIKTQTISFTDYQKVSYNGQKGWIVTKRIAGVFAGRFFGRTRAAAVKKAVAA